MKLFTYTSMGEPETMGQDELDSTIIGSAVTQNEYRYSDKVDPWPTLVKVDEMGVGDELELHRFISVKRVK